MRSEDLSELFTGPNSALPLAPVAPVKTRQGRIITFDAATGENTVQVGSEVMSNLPLDVVGAVPLAVDDIVQIDTTSPSWFIKGRVSEPGAAVVPTWQVDIAELNDVTLPALQLELADVLPITETDISDDAITTPKLAANAVTAEKIAANTITANEIAADSITGNELSADAINGLVITGAEIRTDSAGKRIALNDPGHLNQIALFSGNTGEITPALIAPVLGGANFGKLELRSPALVADQYAFIDMEGYDDGHSSLLAQASNVTLVAENDAEISAPVISLTDGADGFDFAGQTITADGPVTVTAPSVDIVGGLTKSTVPVATTTGAETLTNKDLTSLTNAFPFRIATGNHLFSPYGTANVLASQAIAFPVGRFTATPIVVATARTAANATVHVAVASESASGFTLYFRRADATITNVGWIAIQA